ncbi:MAG: helix-turn-helix domain-containing protein [Pirellulales bacterium]|nr:helix-turn-helix domain-containing protein [Pirellulales bacterium]
MAKFLQLAEAASTLGISEERLNELREAQEIRAFRDGGGWKFREEDITELAQSMSAGGDAGDSLLGLDDDLTLDLDEVSADDDAKTVLVSDLELGGSDATTESTVLKGGAPELSDIELDVADDEPAPGVSDLSLSGVGFGSDVSLEEDEDAKPEPSGVGSQFEDLEDLDVELEAGPGSDVSLVPADEGGSELTLIEDDNDDDDILASDSDAGSAVELGEDDDEELVLGPGSDITGSAADSGISLLDPADSGLSLEEEPLELSGSVAESLELGEDDMISLEDEPASTEDATQLASEGDFDLTPLDEDSGEGDSSSQVIELDESGVVSDEADTLLGGAAAAGAGADMLLDEDLAADEAADPLSPSPLGEGSPLVATTAPEAPFSIWNVLGLFLCVLVMAVGGMMTWELFRTMSTWDQPHDMPATVMNKLIELVGF